MKVEDINQTLIGKRVSCVFTGLRTTGVVIGIVDEKYSKGLRIKFDNPVEWVGGPYKEYESTARKHDNWGNLSHTQLI